MIESSSSHLFGELFFQQSERGLIGSDDSLFQSEIVLEQFIDDMIVDGPPTTNATVRTTPPVSFGNIRRSGCHFSSGFSFGKPKTILPDFVFPPRDRT